MCPKRWIALADGRGRTSTGTLLLFVICLSCVTSAHVSAQDEGNLYNTGVDIRLGERYFQRQCSRCHGPDARGDDETGAPDLTGNLSRASSDAGIFTIIRQGIAGTAMLPVPGETPDATVWQLVAFINSLRNDPANIDLPGSPARGQAIYRSLDMDCARCHMIDGNGGRQGPDLSRIGDELTPDQIKLALTDPDAEVDPRWWTLRVTQKNGEQLQGLRMNEDTFGLRLMDDSANLWSFRKNQLESYQRLETSTMPGYVQLLTDSELDDLVAYLFSLRKEN